MITLLTYLILLWIVNAWHDSDYYNKKDAHVSGAVFACLAVAGIFILQLIGLKIRDGYDILNITFLSLTLRWVVFDISYNLFIGQKWYYKGNTAWIDRNIPNWLQLCLKSVALFFCCPIVAAFINYMR